MPLLDPTIWPRSEFSYAQIVLDPFQLLGMDGSTSIQNEP